VLPAEVLRLGHQYGPEMVTKIVMYESEHRKHGHLPD
jgi:hypothetical protein